MAKMTRRQVLKVAGAGAAALAMAKVTDRARAAAVGGGDPPYTLPKLPYAFDALEPHIDARTMEIHHDRHHQAYVDNLNKALSAHPDLQKKPLDELLRGGDKLPEAIRMAVRNNGGGHLNHSMFWQMMAKGG